jgi:hypothetical protein
MEQIPTAEDILSKKFNELRSSFTLKDVEECMIEFAKLHVKNALEASANEYYPKDKENFELVAERFINAYSLENIK